MIIESNKTERFGLIFFTIIACILILLLVFLKDTLHIFTLLESTLMITYFFVTLSIMDLRGIYSINSFFLITFGLFLLSRILINPISNTVYYYYDGSFGKHFWTPEARLYTLVTLILALLTHYITTLNLYFVGKAFKVSMRKKLNVRSRFLNDVKRYSWLKTCKVLFLFAFPFSLALNLFEFVQVLNGGYVSIYKSALSTPRILELSRFIVQISYFGFLASNKKFGTYCLFSGLYFTFLLTDALKGGRLTVVAFILFFVCFMKYRYKESFKLRIASIAFILGLPLLQLVTLIRLNQSKLFNFLDSYRAFLFDNGVSLNVIGLTYTYMNKLPYHPYPYVLEPLTRVWTIFTNSVVRSGGQNTEIISNRFNLAHHLSYTLNPIAYEKGAGIGNSYLAELSELGIFGLVIGSILLSIIIFLIEQNLTRSFTLRYFSLIIVTHFFVMARAEYFIDTYTILKYLGGYIIIWTICIGYHVAKKTLLKRKA